MGDPVFCVTLISSFTSLGAQYIWCGLVTSHKGAGRGDSSPQCSWCRILTELAAAVRGWAGGAGRCQHSHRHQPNISVYTRTMMDTIIDNIIYKLQSIDK